MIKIFNENELTKERMYQFYSTRVSSIRFSPLDLAAVDRPAEILETMLDQAWVKRCNYYEDGSWTECDNGEWDCCLIRNIVPSSLIPADKEDAHNRSIILCLERITENRINDDIAKLIHTKPLKMCVSSLAKVRTWVFVTLFLFHVAYMCCFSIFVIPTCSIGNDTAARRDTAFSVNPSFVAFTAWPGILLLYEAVCLFAVVRSKSLRDIIELIWKRMKIFWQFCTDDNAARSSQYLPYFAIVSHVSTVVFCSLVIAWFVMYTCAHIDSDHFKSYVNMVAIILLYGWIQTMEFVKGWPTIHAFCVMLKVIFVRDILRIIFIYLCFSHRFCAGFSCLRCCWN